MVPNEKIHLIVDSTGLSGRVLALTIGLVLASGCRIPLEENDWEAYDGPGAVYFQAEELEFPLDLMKDPLESINRPISVFNYAVLYGIVQPIAWVHRHVVPKPARESIGKAFDNALYPMRLLNNLLQGKWGGAGRETQRFLINTTVGGLGLFDPAKSKWDILASREDFGQTLHKWGWRHSPYLVIPILGPSSVRDAVGLVGDNFADPLTYWRPEGQYLQYYRVFNRLTDLVPGIVEFVERNYDPYQLSKLLYILNREIQTEDYSFEVEDTRETQTLQAIFFEPEDPEWDDEGNTYEVDLPNGRSVVYTAWIQDEPAPLLYFIPGTGAHRLESSALAVSEIMYENVRSVVTISSVLNTEFIDKTLTSAVPGFLPADSLDTHMALDAIHADLVERYSEGHFTDLWLAGLSLGGMTTLHIAAQNDDPDDTLIDFDAYFPLDCPISLRHAMATLDRFFNTPLQFPAEERMERLRALFRKVLDLATSGDLKPTEELPFVEWEARFLIGFAFRLTTIATIQQTQENEDLGVLKTRRTWYRRSMSYMECSTFSFEEYLYAFVLPYFAEVRDDIAFDEEGAERMMDLCDLRSIEDELRGREDIIYFANRNDPLLRPEDIRWVEETFGDRAHFFEEGGHIGNLSQKSVQEAIRHIAQRHLK